jgi:GH3 auxin-responsive promoter
MALRAFGLLSRCFLAAHAGSYRRYLDDLASPQRAQDRLLGELVRGIAGTEYGRRHGIERGDPYEDFARKLPIVGYDDIEPWVRRQAASRRRVLCPDRVAFCESTSGSSGPSKPIPFTPALQRSFVRMFLLWAHDCLAHGPRLGSGSVFISVSPNLLPREAVSGALPQALQDDMDFLPPILRWLFGRYLVLPRSLRHIRDPHLFKRILAACLIDEPALEVISVWNPSYFSSLLDFIDSNRSQIAADLRAGRIAAGARRFHLARGTAARRRRCADALELGPPDFAALWPQLKLLSCWTDGNAALVLEPLRRRLPHARVQGKGLVATEAPMTIPLWEASAPAPLLSEVFLEFARDDGKVLRLHEIEQGVRYDVILTQRGGLARYRIGDRVEVAGRVRATPTLRFVGRSQEVSDLVGEKLNENFVRDALRRHAALERVRWMLLPSVVRGRAGYICLVDGPQVCGDLAAGMDDSLQDAYHYRLARQLGQLAPLRVQRHEGLDRSYLAWSESQGRKWGNVKPRALLSGVERAASFLRYLRERPQRHDPVDPFPAGHGR